MKKILLLLLLPLFCYAQNVDNIILYLRGNIEVTETGAGVSTWADQSGNGYDFLQGTDADRPAYVGSRYLDFDKANTEFLELADNNDFSFTNGANDLPFSIVARVNMDDLTNSRIIAKNGSPTTLEWILSFSAADKFYLACYQVDDATDYMLSIANNAQPQGSWITVGASYTGSGSASGVELYLNGAPLANSDSDVDYPGMTNSSAKINIGRQENGPLYADGKISDILMTSDVLTPTEMANIHTFFSGGTFPSTVYYIDADYGKDNYAGDTPQFALASFDSINTAGVTLDVEDTIALKTGTTLNDTLMMPQDTLTIISYDSASTILYGLNTTSNKPILDSTNWIIDFNDKDNIILENLEFRNGLLKLNGSSNSVIRYCEFDSADANALLLDGKTNSIYYNKFLNATTDAIEVDSSANTIYNNIFWNGTNGIDVDTNVTVRNNAFWSNSGDDINIAATATVTGGYNSYQDAARAGTGTYSGTSLWATYPIWTDTTTLDFTLQSTSPCIDAGTSVGLTLDYVGNVVPFGSAPDIGAYESQISGYKPLKFKLWKKFKTFKPVK